MSVPDAMGERWLPASSGVLLGRVVRAFCLNDPDVSGRENLVDGEPVAVVLKKDRVTEYFAGARVKPETESLVLLAIAKALVGSGVLPADGLLGQSRSGKIVEPHVPVVVSLGTLVLAWDQVLSGVRSLSASVLDRRLVSLPFLRLFTIELALRLMAYLVLSEKPAPKEMPVPTWARPEGANALVEALLGELPGGRPGPVEVSGELLRVSGHSVSHQAVSKWFLHHEPPGDDSLRALAVWLSSRLGREPGALLGDLRRHVGLWRVCVELAGVVGWEAVREAADRLVSYSSCAWALVGKFGTEALVASMRETFVAGCLRTGETGGNATLTGWIADGQVKPGPWMQVEADPLWRTELLVVGETAKAFSVNHPSAFLYAWNRRWDKLVRRIQSCLQRSSGLERVRSLLPEELLAGGEEGVLRMMWTYNRFWSFDTCELLELAAQRSPVFDADLSEQVASNEEAFGQLDAALDVWSEAVRLAPNDAYKAFRLGALHGELGNVKAAEHWLNKAASLSAGWLLPRLEVARVYLHVGDAPRALERLQSLDLLEVRDNLFGLVLLSEACFQLKKWDLAREFAAELARRQDDNAEAFLRQALACRRLANATQDREARKALFGEGRDAAKQARLLGVEDAIHQFEQEVTG